MQDAHNEGSTDLLDKPPGLCYLSVGIVQIVQAMVGDVAGIDASDD